MKTIKNDYLIRMFVSSDKYRPAMHEVSLCDGYLYSTNGYIAAKIKADLCVKNYESITNFPNVEKVLTEHKLGHKSKLNALSVLDMFNSLMKFECCFKPEMIECNDCSGQGTYICSHCDSECDCKKCNGTGEIEGDKMILSSENQCTLFGLKYELKYLDLILKTAIYTGIEKIQIMSNNHSGLFFVGDFEILLIAKNNNYDSTRD